jgi:predicted N-acyltransferase
VTPGDWFPNLVLAAPGYDSGAVGREVASSAAACAFLDLAVGWAARQGLKAMAVLYRPPGAGALAAALAASGFARAELTERNLLELPEGGFEGYLTRLPYKRRKEARREVRRLEAAGVRTGPAQLEACAGQVVALRAALVRRYGAYSDESAEAARLQALLRELGPKRLRLFTSRTGGEEVLAFSLWLDWGGSWHVVWFGQRYGHPAARNLYFDAAFYAPVRAAASEGVRRLDLGVAHVEAKRARGCRVVPVDGWFRSLAAGAAEAAMREAASLLAPAGAEGG